MLAEVFRCTDTIVSMLHNRKERIVLEKLTKAVQNMMRKNFGEKFLKQIKCVFPQAYFYAWEKVSLSSNQCFGFVHFDADLTPDFFLYIFFFLEKR